jgi:hypothetical protein
VEEQPCAPDPATFILRLDPGYPAPVRIIETYNIEEAFRVAEVLLFQPTTRISFTVCNRRDRTIILEYHYDPRGLRQACPICGRGFPIDDIEVPPTSGVLCRSCRSTADSAE